MSEKRSNGQVPEEGPDGKNLEQSEKKESFAFLFSQNHSWDTD